MNLCNDLPIQEILGNESDGEKIKNLIKLKRIEIIDKEKTKKISK